MSAEFSQIFCHGNVLEGRWIWGWQCFGCGEMGDDFGNASTAAEAKDNHDALCSAGFGITYQPDDFA